MRNDAARTDEIEARGRAGGRVLSRSLWVIAGVAIGVVGAAWTGIGPDRRGPAVGVGGAVRTFTQGVQEASATRPRRGDWRRSMAERPHAVR
jgi:hypothetical protein